MTIAQRNQILSTSLLGFVCFFAVVREFGVGINLAPVAGAALLIWIALEWRNLVVIARLTVLVALVLGLVFFAQGNLPLDVLARAIERSAFFTLFLVAMDILRTAAMSSRMVLESGRMIVNQPPGRRYTMITLGGHLFAMLLNLGAINLLGTMNRRSIETASNEPDPAIREIRLRRMTLALVRGFTAFTMWAPTAVTVLVVLSAIPNFDWYQFAPMGAVVAAIYMVFGWVLDRLSHPRRGPVVGAQPLGQVLMSLMPMSLLTVGILTVAVFLSWASGIRPIAALLMCVPLFGMIWIIVQYARAGPIKALLLGKRRILGRVLPDLVTLRAEISMLSSAGFIAVILPHQIDTERLGHFIAGLGLTEGWLLVLMMWAVAITAPIGLNPIISVAVSVEILAQLAGFDFNPYALAFGGIVAWGLATGYSPFGATIRITGRSIDRAPHLVGLVWNRPFTAYILIAASAILILVN
jgi:hypothetical protein